MERNWIVSELFSLKWIKLYLIRNTVHHIPENVYNREALAEATDRARVSVYDTLKDFEANKMPRRTL
jgi:hypothetical protein